MIPKVFKEVIDLGDGREISIETGKLAKQAGVNIETVRHYQRKNLIQEPDKPEGGFRYYPYDTIEQIRFIKRAQQLGFSLKEIEQLLLLGSEHCHDVQALAREKSEMIKRMADLQGQTIKEIIEEYQKRVSILKYLKEHNIRDYRETSEIIGRYYRNPNEVLNTIHYEV